MEQLSKETLEGKYKAKIVDPLCLYSIDHVNFRPHPFTIGAKHVEHASDHCGGMLGEETCRAIPCAHPGCRTAYEDHTSDNVMFLQLTRNATSQEVRAVLIPLQKEMEEDKIDGVAFVENPGKFRFVAAQSDPEQSAE